MRRPVRSLVDTITLKMSCLPSNVRHCLDVVLLVSPFIARSAAWNGGPLSSLGLGGGISRRTVKGKFAAQRKLGATIPRRDR